MSSMLPARVDFVLDLYAKFRVSIVCETLTYTVSSKAVPRVVLRRHCNLAVLCSS